MGATMADRESDATVYHVIPLANFARGYDRHDGAYHPSRVPGLRFDGRFFVLSGDELGIRPEDADPPADGASMGIGCLLAMGSRPDHGPVHAPGNRLEGRHFHGESFPVRELYLVNDGRPIRISFHDALTASSSLLGRS